MLKILLFVLLIAVVIYGLVRVFEKRAVKRQPPKQVAPDDDLNFLRDLDWQQRKDRQRRRKDGSGEGSGDGNGASDDGSADDGEPGTDEPDEPTTGS